MLYSVFSSGRRGSLLGFIVHDDFARKYTHPRICAHLYMHSYGYMLVYVFSL